MLLASNIASFSPDNSLLMPFPFLGTCLSLIWFCSSHGRDWTITKIALIPIYNVSVMNENDKALPHIKVQQELTTLNVFSYTLKV